MLIRKNLTRLEFPLDFYWVRLFLKPARSCEPFNPLDLHDISYDTLSLLLSKRDSMHLHL